MAIDEKQRQRLRIIAGFGYLSSGQPVSVTAMRGLPTGALDELIGDYVGQVDQNVKPPRAAQANGPAMFGQSGASAEPDGARDRLIKLLQDAKNGSLNGQQQNAVIAAMTMANYPGMTFPPNAAQLAQMDDFRTHLGRGERIGDIASANGAAINENRLTQERLAAEQQQQAAAQQRSELQQTARSQQFGAALVYAGYLDPAKINDPNAAAVAMNSLIADTVPGHEPEWAGVQRAAFPGAPADWKPSDAGLDFIRQNTRGPDLRLQADLQSTDPKLNQMAQTYMAFRGITNPETSVRAPLTIPGGLILANGKPALGTMYNLANHGQLYLPESALDDKQRAVAATLPSYADGKPGMTREMYIATRLIYDDTAQYQRLLDAENQQRLTRPLNMHETMTPEQRAADNQRFVAIQLHLPTNLSPYQIGKLPDGVRQLVEATMKVEAARTQLDRATGTTFNFSNPAADTPVLVAAAREALHTAEYGDPKQNIEGFNSVYDHYRREGKLPEIQQYIQRMEQNGGKPVAPAKPGQEPGPALVSDAGSHSPESSKKFFDVAAAKPAPAEPKKGYSANFDLAALGKLPPGADPVQPLGPAANRNRGMDLTG